MHSLFLDLGSNKGSIACVTDTQTTKLVTVDHRIDDSVLMQLIESTAKDAGWTLKDLTHIACVTGPGGFTSLRVGVATANALTYGLKIPAAGIQLSDLYRFRVAGYELREKLETRNSKLATVVWLHSTKKTELFIREETDAEARCVKVEELPSILKKGGEWMGELIPEQEKVVTELGLSSAQLRPLVEVLPSFLSSLSYGKETLLPWYGRGW